MKDDKVALNFAYVIIMSLVTLMGIDYLGVVAPELLGDSFIMDMLAPLSFQHARSIRIGFIIGSAIIFAVNPTSEMIGDSLARRQQRKFAVAAIFLLSSIIIVFVHRLPFILFSTLYPLGFVLFNITGFVLGNLLKTREKVLERPFGFEKNLSTLKTPYSFHWESEHDGGISIHNVFRGVLFLGGAGAGKSYTIAQPLIEQGLGAKAMTGLVYDLKMQANFSEKREEWALTRYVYMSFIYHGSVPAKRDEKGKWIGEHSIKNDRRSLWIVNFRDIRYSHRVNVIHPRYMPTQAFANEYALALLQNLKPEWVKSRDFFADSAVIYLKGIYWFLKSQFPESCSLPVAVTIAFMPHNKVLAMLALDKQCTEIISSLLVAEKKNAEAQLAGAVASLQVPLDKINTPEIFWILSGDDFSLFLNDPEDPGVLCLGNDPELKETYSPVAALIATVVKKSINKPGKLPSMFHCDEKPSLIVPGISELPAQARSNLVATILGGQDMSQFVVNYGKEQTDALFANLGNQMFGQLNHLETAKMASETIGTREKENRSVNSSKSMGESLSKSAGENIAIQRENLIHPYELMTLRRGQFVGKVAEVPEQDPYSPFFNVKPKITPIYVPHEFPMLLEKEGKRLTIEEAEGFMLKNYEQIKAEAYKLVDHCARASCLAGLADETKVFPQHFYKGRRIVSTLGEAMVRGIIVDLETGIVSGTPEFDDDMPGK